jgi:hypothetical protein
MTEDALVGQTRNERIEDHRMSRSVSEWRSDTGIIGQALGAATRLYPAPSSTIAPLLVTGAIFGVVGDTLLRGPDPIALNLSLWVASVAVAALVLHRRAALALDRGRIAWLMIGVVAAAGLAWRDAPPLKLLALACATLVFALAAFRLDSAWVRRAGVLRYAAAVALGSLHTWAAAVLALVDESRSPRRVHDRDSTGWRRVAAVVRGLAIAAPLLVVFGALFVSADAVFASLVTNVLRFDFGRIAGHVVLFVIAAWLATGYLRGFLTGTEPQWLGDRRHGAEHDDEPAPTRPGLGITEVATALAAIDLLFLVFVIVQFRYLFGGDALVQVTPDLTYAEYARRGFFELVVAVALVVPVLLAADGLLRRRSRRDELAFRGLAGLQIALVLAIAASALQRLRLYHASYGLTDSRLYAMVLLLWMGVVLLWLAATVLRGRRDSFAFGALVSGLMTVALLFAINPDAIVARTNVARMMSPGATGRFDVAYATSLSGDAAPLLIVALPALPPDVQCPLARHMLRRWPPDRDRSIRNWNWSAARAADAVRAHETMLRSMVEPGSTCAAPPAP